MLVAEQAILIEHQGERIHELEARIQTLEARLAQDSHNSSKPPSSDPPFQKLPPCSQRQPSGRKPGGQAGRRGVPPVPWSTTLISASLSH
ncbi:DUF6444 domain-containing protein [Candidatus Thiosymbion oneisti]|uniref:DUF6444 domain-containing protein n=1 Tax=Candidatus Thiosymbion oneisti TaxID=589554 RepID=UPI000A44DCF7